MLQGYVGVLLLSSQNMFVDLQFHIFAIQAPDPRDFSRSLQQTQEVPGLPNGGRWRGVTTLTLSTTNR